MARQLPLCQAPQRHAVFEGDLMAGAMPPSSMFENTSRLLHAEIQMLPFFLFFFFLLLFRLRFSFPFFLGGRGGYRYKTPHLTSSPLKEQSIHLKHRCSVVLTATQHALRCRPEDPLCYTDASFSGICCCFFNVYSATVRLC